MKMQILKLQIVLFSFSKRYRIIFAANTLLTTPKYMVE